jgi:hypothetical protein
MELAGLILFEMFPGSAVFSRSLSALLAVQAIQSGMRPEIPISCGEVMEFASNALPQIGGHHHWAFPPFISRLRLIDGRMHSEPNRQRILLHRFWKDAQQHFTDHPVKWDRWLRTVALRPPVCSTHRSMLPQRDTRVKRGGVLGNKHKVLAY